MAISKPDGFPTYAVVEDSPQRLVLQTRGSVYFPAAIMLVFAVFWISPYIFGGVRVTVLFVLSAIFLVLTLFFLLRWRRFIFDTTSATVRFDSILFGRWVKNLSVIDDVETDSFQQQITEKVGSAERTRYQTVYRAFLVINGNKLRLNQNKSAGFIGDIRSRILSMRTR